MSAIEITATPSAQPEASSIQTSQTEAQGTPQSTDDSGKGKVQRVPGSEFAALDRRRKAVEKAEQEFRAKQTEFEQRQSAVPDYSKADTLELLEKIAKARGREPDDLIKEYIARKTGGPSHSEALAKSTDPAIIALRDEMRKSSEEKEQLRKQIEERDRREQERAQAQAAEKARDACLGSSKAVYSDGSDYTFFWDTPESLADDVESACNRELVEYFSRYHMKPALSDVEEMVREMPSELLKKRLESHAGKRVLELKQRAAIPPPTAPVQGFRPPIRKSAEEKPKQPSIVTRMDNDRRLEEAISRWPKGVLLPGQQHTPE